MTPSGFYVGRLEAREDDSVYDIAFIVRSVHPAPILVSIFTAYIVMVYIVMVYIVMAYIVMAYMVMAYKVMVYIAMAYLVMANIVMVYMPQASCLRPM